LTTKAKQKSSHSNKVKSSKPRPLASTCWPRNASSADAPTTVSQRMPGSANQSHRLPWLRTQVKQKSAIEISDRPIQSNGRRTRATGFGPSAIKSKPEAASATGTTLKKIHVQDRASISHPCKAGAIVAGATTDPIANKACRIGCWDRG